MLPYFMMKYMFHKIKEVAMALSYHMEDTSKSVFDEIDTGGHGRGSLKNPSSVRA